MKSILVWLMLLPMILSGENRQPESSSGFVPKKMAMGATRMVVSANPLATQAGLEMLQQGGSALDAAIAIQLVLNVVEPQSSGIGGGALLLYYHKKSGKVIAYDGRECAPKAVTEKWFLDKKGRPIPLSEAMIGGRSVGVPGLLKMLELAHNEQGRLPWRSLFSPAIRLAREGFAISPRLSKLVRENPFLKLSPPAFAYFYEGDRPKREGELLYNRELEYTLTLLAERGIEPFYQGEIGEALVSTVQQQGGALTMADLTSYAACTREPIVTEFGESLIYGFPPPSSGGITIAQMLQMIEAAAIEFKEFGSPDFIDFFCYTSRLAYADRDFYIADPDFFPVPVSCLLDRTYLQHRIKKRVSGAPAPGAYPRKCLKQTYSTLTLSETLEFPSTTHFCVVDDEGNALSMTASIENAFGSTVMSGGFFLNNQLTDFSLVPERAGLKVANRVEPGKRPMSSMTPTLVIKKDSNEIFLAVGSAGGARIIDYVAKVLLGVLQFNLNVQEAIDFPNFTSINKVIDMESGRGLEDLVAALETKGNEVKLIPLTSGTQAIQRLPSMWIGAADPRREGEAQGK